jgi:hypothetical protein
MDPAEVLKMSGGAISLIAALTKLIKENQNNSTPLSALLGRLQLDAVRLSSDLERKLEILRERLPLLGLHAEISLEHQLATLEWYEWKRRSQLKTFREDFNSVCRQLTAFIDDSTALLLCEGSHVPQKQVKTEMFRVAFEKKREVDAIVNSRELTLGAVIDALLQMARGLTEEIRAA